MRIGFGRSGWRDPASPYIRGMQQRFCFQSCFDNLLFRMH
jgi:hypothetical protein